MPSAFTLDTDEYGYILLIDGGLLDAPEPMQVRDDFGDVRLADDPLVRIRLDNAEGAELWRLLDSTIGEHQREGEKVREEVERTRQEGLPTDLPSRMDYQFAKEAMADPELAAFLSDEERARHQEVVTVYERAHGLRTSGRSR